MWRCCYIFSFTQEVGRMGIIRVLGGGGSRWQPKVSQFRCIFSLGLPSFTSSTVYYPVFNPGIFSITVQKLSHGLLSLCIEFKLIIHLQKYMRLARRPHLFLNQTSFSTLFWFLLSFVSEVSKCWSSWQLQKNTILYFIWLSLCLTSCSDCSLESITACPPALFLKV